jgi:hypothetical protein
MRKTSASSKSLRRSRDQRLSMVNSIVMMHTEEEEVESSSGGKKGGGLAKRTAEKLQ